MFRTRARAPRSVCGSHANLAENGGALLGVAEHIQEWERQHLRAARRVMDTRVLSQVTCRRKATTKEASTSTATSAVVA